MAEMHGCAEVSIRSLCNHDNWWQLERASQTAATMGSALSMAADLLASGLVATGGASGVVPEAPPARSSMTSSTTAATNRNQVSQEKAAAHCRRLVSAPFQNQRSMSDREAAQPNQKTK